MLACGITAVSVYSVRYGSITKAKVDTNMSKLDHTIRSFLLILFILSPRTNEVERLAISKIAIIILKCIDVSVGK